MSGPTGIVKNKKQKQNTQRAVLPVHSSQAGQITICSSVSQTSDNITFIKVCSQGIAMQHVRCKRAFTSALLPISEKACCQVSCSSAACDWTTGRRGANR